MQDHIFEAKYNPCWSYNFKSVPQHQLLLTEACLITYPDFSSNPNLTLSSYSGGLVSRQCHGNAFHGTFRVVRSFLIWILKMSFE
jgi:hypothetical protein